MRLPEQILWAEVGGQVGVGRGVPLSVVDAVDDAREVVLPLSEEALKAVAVLGGLDLAGVGVRDRGEPRGVKDAGLQVVDRASGEALLVELVADATEADPGE